MVAMGSRLSLFLSLIFCLVTQTVAIPLRSPEWQSDRSVESSKYLPRQSNSYVDGTMWLNRTMGDQIWMFNISIGTPGQSISTQIDTGSNWFYVIGHNATQCDVADSVCAIDALFNPAQSSSYSVLEFDGFSEGFSFGAETGDSFMDHVTVESTVVPNVKMGIGYNITASDTFETISTLGLGWGDQHKMPPIVQSMRGGSLIERAAFSTYFDHDLGVGQLLFGAVDHAKYTGNLVKVPLVSHTSHSADFLWIEFSSVSYNGGSFGKMLTASNFSHDMIIDTGSGGMNLPQELMDTFVSDLGFVEQNGDYAGPCDYKSSNASLTFGLGGDGGAQINVPLSVFVGDHAKNFKRDGSNGNQQDLCSFTQSVAKEGDNGLLGMSFLLQAYVVFDLEDKSIIMAQAAPSATGNKKIEALGSL